MLTPRSVSLPDLFRLARAKGRSFHSLPLIYTQHLQEAHTHLLI